MLTSVGSISALLDWLWVLKTYLAPFTKSPWATNFMTGSCVASFLVSWLTGGSVESHIETTPSALPEIMYCPVLQIFQKKKTMNINTILVKYFNIRILIPVLVVRTAGSLLQFLYSIFIWNLRHYLHFVIISIFQTWSYFDVLCKIFLSAFCLGC